MPYAVLAPSDSTFARKVAAALTAASGADVPRFTIEPSADQTGGVDGTTVMLGGIRLDSADGIFITGFRYEDPVLPPAGGDVDWSLWQSRHVLRQQGYSFMWTMLSRIEAAGVPLFNPPSALLSAFCRARPLDLIRAAGLKVPHITVTNDAAVAERLQSAGGLVVWRPVTGRAAWQLFRAKQRRALLGPDRPPVMLAPAIDGAMLRCYVVAGKVALVVGTVPSSREGLERFELIVPTPSASVAGIGDVTKAAEALGLRWGCFTIIATADGPVIYDVDPDPVADDLPVRLRDHLAQALACGMTGQPLPAEPGGDAEERPTLLLRRMLTIQFEMEQTKHTDD